MQVSEILDLFLESVSTQPEIKLTHGDLVVGLVHGLMLHSGFRLVENESMSDWNINSDMFRFKYKHEQSAMTFLVKAIKMENEMIFHGMAVEDGHLFTFKVSLPEIVATGEWTNPSKEILFDSLNHGKTNTLLLSPFYSEMIQKLIPDHFKPGYQSESNPQPERNESFPNRSYISNSYSRQQQPFGNPYSVGRADLDPLAAAPGILPPGVFGSSGFNPIPDMRSNGGMIVGPDHPMFYRPEGQSPWIPSGNGRLPPGAVPPGARFDPITPMGPQPGFMNRPRPNIRPHPMPFSGEPDNDDLGPPDYNNMFM